jgi:hypothetical protein
MKSAWSYMPGSALAIGEGTCSGSAAANLLPGLDNHTNGLPRIRRIGGRP